jgi:hypothetical protein
VANVVAGLGWTSPGYSWATHDISDLGNVHCGTWDSTRPRYVCSPRHGTFDASMLVMTALLLVGLVLTWRALGHGDTLLGGMRRVSLVEVDVDGGVGGMERVPVFAPLLWAALVGGRSAVSRFPGAPADPAASLAA